MMEKQEPYIYNYMRTGKGEGMGRGTHAVIPHN